MSATAGLSGRPCAQGGGAAGACAADPCAGVAGVCAVGADGLAGVGGAPGAGLAGCCAMTGAAAISPAATAANKTLRECDGMVVMAFPPSGTSAPNFSGVSTSEYRLG